MSIFLSLSLSLSSSLLKTAFFPHRATTWSHLFLVCRGFINIVAYLKKCVHVSVTETRQRESRSRTEELTNRPMNNVFYFFLFFFLSSCHALRANGIISPRPAMSLSESQKEHFTHTILEHFSRTDPSSRWICGYFLQCAPTGPSGDAPGFHGCPFNLPHCTKYPRYCQRHVCGVLLFCSKQVFAFFQNNNNEEKEKGVHFLSEGVQHPWMSCRGHAVTQRRISTVINELTWEQFRPV